MEVRLSRRPTNRNVKGKRFVYAPTVVTAHKELKAGSIVFALEDATGKENKIVVVTTRTSIYCKDILEKEKFTVFLNDLIFY